ncbi:TR10B factor, partial [Brachypteracias leptosomus]|nr:TR10B factor [Brachypteracias leptosomus]
CSQCQENEYIEYPNGFHQCLGCQKCREDQVELSPCQADRNTQCVCRNGTFCSPDHPCEMCQKCQPWCPKGEVELAPCTPHSDLQCGPPPPTSFSSKWGGCWRRGGGTRDGGDYLVRQLTRFRRGGLGTQDNRYNEQVCQDQLLPRPGELEVPCGMSFLGDPSLPDPPCSELFPSPPVLRDSFYTFAEVVPLQDWRKYARVLGLQENDIYLAERTDKCSQEPFFQMLNTWYNKQGMNASVNTLLETLHHINLGGVAEEISTKLVQKGFFQYEGS